MTLKWSVPDLMPYKNEGLTLDETIELPEMSEQDDEIRDLSPIRITGFAEVKARLISFHLTLKGKMVLPCSITLKNVDQPFEVHTSETFRLDSSLDLEDGHGEEIHDVDNQVIDLIPFIKEAILVEKPIRVVSEEAKNQPKPEGKGWEVVTDEERKNRIDPRLEKLKQFYDD
ncbi:YceD family protein [Tuberibacillus sp. Marseille-P3662]|uniref:YceD family protein n=1 Tax=Tuberibacillus sp. Marseille-P3662 TaxID=1965358 RepID=UPI000A1CE23B|nr:YceD family protein [Tuberibacillus sp. Marseille-P3662]